MKSNVIDMDGAIEAKTEKAVLFHDGDKSKAVWLLVFINSQTLD